MVSGWCGKQKHVSFALMILGGLLPYHEARSGMNTGSDYYFDRTGIKAAARSDLLPPVRLSDENSRGKVQNVYGGSSGSNL
jgi:hypothetical protein